MCCTTWRVASKVRTAGGLFSAEQSQTSTRHLGRQPGKRPEAHWERHRQNEILPSSPTHDTGPAEQFPGMGDAPARGPRLGKQMDQQLASVVDDGDGAHSCWWTTATARKNFQHWRRQRVLTMHAAVPASMLPSDDSCPLCEFRCSHNCAQSLKAASGGGAHYISTWV